MVQSDYSLESSCMGKHHLSVDIAYGIDMGNISLHEFIDCNSAWCEFDTGICKIERTHISTTAYSHQNLVGCNTLFLSFTRI